MLQQSLLPDFQVIEGVTADGLYPLPGSKGDRKYDPFLYREPWQSAMCGAFMGAAARSILENRKGIQNVVLGEIDTIKRAIARIPAKPSQHQAFIDGYRQAQATFWGDIHKPVVIQFAGEKNPQKLFALKQPELYKGLGDRWRVLRNRVFHAMDSLCPEDAGWFMFATRASFGNVLRTNKTGDDFNTSYHVDKLKAAESFSPEAWLATLHRQGWNPVVLPSWEAAIAHVEDPSQTWIEVDPPYWVDGVTHKMTSCYTNHEIGLKQGHDITFSLATDSLAMALDRRFPIIYACNYYSDRLQATFEELTGQAGYQMQRVNLGPCEDLGNSNGRREHGDRVDKREKPHEWIWRIALERSETWERSARRYEAKQRAKKTQTGEQLKLLSL